MTTRYRKGDRIKLKVKMLAGNSLGYGTVICHHDNDMIIFKRDGYHSFDKCAAMSWEVEKAKGEKNAAHNNSKKRNRQKIG